MVPHVFNPSTWKGEAGRSLGSRLFRATKKKKYTDENGLVLFCYVYIFYVLLLSDGHPFLSRVDLLAFLTFHLFIFSFTMFY